MLSNKRRRGGWPQHIDRPPCSILSTQRLVTMATSNTAAAAAATCRLAFVLLLAGLASGARQLQQEALAQSAADAQASISAANSSRIVHMCLWASASAAATASVTRTGQAGAAAQATAAIASSPDALPAQPSAAAATATATAIATASSGSGGTAAAAAVAGAAAAGDTSGYVPGQMPATAAV